MTVKLSHIAIACPHVEEISRKLEALSMGIAEVHEVPTEAVKASMVPVEVSEKLCIELLEPMGESSPLNKYLSKFPRGGIHHLSFEVQGLESWLSRLERAGLEVLAPGIRQSARGRALFIHPKSFSGVLVELEEIIS